MASRRTLAIAAGVVLAGLLVGQAWAAERPAPVSAPASQPASAPAPSDRLALWDANRLDYRTRDEISLPWAQMAASILILIVLGAAALMVTRKVLPRLRPPAGRSVRVIETTYVAPRQALHLVEVAGRRYLLAGNKEGLSMLTEVGGSFEQHVQERLKQTRHEEPST